MKARIAIDQQSLEIDFAGGRSLAIELDPHGAQPSFFTGQPATARALKDGAFIGDVRQGGSCNAEVVSFAPHCHGTHTEGIGHISQERTHVQHSIYAEPTLARLISLEAAPANRPDEHPTFTLAALQEALGDGLNPGEQALIVRQLPQPEDLAQRDYSHAAPYPVFAHHAVRWLAQQNLKHLLLDSPSLDAANDGGRLLNHRAWWGVDAPPHPRIDSARRSITELILVPEDVLDGSYWLQLELSPVLGDATPSRPMVYPIQRV